MARAKIVVDDAGLFYGIRYRCPCDVCGLGTVLRVNWLPDGMQASPHAAQRDGWGFNGDMDLPTFTPSVLTRSGHYGRENELPGFCHCDFAERYPDEPPETRKCGRCHSFVTDGRIQFLDDCTHALRGQTVDLPAIEA